MTKRLLPVCIVAGFALVAAARSPGAQNHGATSTRWFKGNTHTHTVNSDGDSTPDEVVRWYREHGYNFLVLTDHNYLTAVDGLNAVHGAADKFIVVRGEEVTSTASSKAVHINGLNVDALVKQSTSPSVVVATQENVDGIRRANGVPHINHPNFTWAMTTDDLMQVQRTRLFEIFNGHPQVNNEGGGGAPGLEEIWDRLLSSGRLMYGVAVDDAHHFKRPGDPLASGPGRGWIYVRAERLESRALVEAMERADFYASTGVELAASRGHATGHHADGEGHDLQPVPGAVHRPERQGPVGADDAGGYLHVQGRRGVRPRARCWSRTATWHGRSRCRLVPAGRRSRSRPQLSSKDSGLSTNAALAYWN